MRFEVIDHTSEVGIAARGAELAEAFANAAYGMFSIMAELEGVEEKVTQQIELEAEDEETLLVEWLTELLYLFEVKGIIFRRFEISQVDGRRLQARAFGEKLDTSRHQLKTAIKAVTYHLLKVEKSNGYRVQVIFDV